MGHPKQVYSMTCMDAEPSYYSTFACNGFSSLSDGRTGKGIRGWQLPSKAPLPGRKGGSLEEKNGERDASGAG